MPERQGGFIGLPVGKADNFDFSQPVGLIQIESHIDRAHAAGVHVRPDKTPRFQVGGVGNLNGWTSAPIGESANINGGQQDEDGQEKPLFFCHI